MQENSNRSVEHVIFYYMEKKVEIIKKYAIFQFVKIRLIDGGEEILIDIHCLTDIPIQEKSISLQMFYGR